MRASAAPVNPFSHLNKIADRLAKVRKDSGLGVRPFAKLVTQNGYAVTHGSVGKYEKEGHAPAEYVATIARTYRKNPAWLLGLVDWPEDEVVPQEAEKRLQRIYEAMQIPTELYKPLPRPTNGQNEEAGGV